MHGTDYMVVDLWGRRWPAPLHVAVLRRAGFKRCLVVDGNYLVPYFRDRELADELLLSWCRNGAGAQWYSSEADVRTALWLATPMKLDTALDRLG
jgi:hypothetical protein